MSLIQQSAAARLRARMGAVTVPEVKPDSEATLPIPSEPEPTGGGAAARLRARMGGAIAAVADTVPATAAAPAESSAQSPAAWAQVAKRDPSQFAITQYLGGKAADWRQNRIDNDIQRIATPLEYTMEGITASGRGLARMADEGMSGHNPLYNSDDQTIPFAEGATDPGYSWETVLRKHVPDFTAGVPPMMLPTGQMTRAGTVNKEQVVGPAGLALSVGLDPASYLGVGSVTKAGKALRAGEIGVDAANMALRSARTYDEAAAATQRWSAARDLLDPAQAAVTAEGTAASKGRALLSFAGRTNPVIAGGPVVGQVQDVMRNLQMTRVGRGLSAAFQPEEKRLPDAARAGALRMAAAGSVGRREALRGLAPQIAEFPKLVKAVGDQSIAEDALATALERSQGKRFDNPLDWLTQAERDRYWQTESDAVREKLTGAGKQRADAGLPSFLDRADQRTLRTARQTLANEGPLREQLTAPVEYSDQLAQKRLSTQERSELQRLMARRAKRENAALAGVNGPEGVGIGMPEIEADAAGMQRPLASAQRARMAPPPGNLANPVEEARIGQLQDLASQREAAARATSLEQLDKATSQARVWVDRMTQKAQIRAHAQALENSVRLANSMYFRGATPEVQAQFGDYATRMAQTVNGRNAAMFSEVARSGNPISELADPLAYMLHATTDEGKKAMVEAAIERGTLQPGMGWSDFLQLRDTGDMTRKLRMTAVEANELAAQGKLSITGGRKVSRFFHTNPLIAQVMRETAAAQSMGTATHLRELAATFGQPVEAAPRGWRAVPNDVVGVGDKVAFPPEIADHLNKHYWALRDPVGFFNTWDRAQQIWKAWTLGIFPVYHTRNEMGDLWNAVVLGGMNLKHLGPAMDDLMHGSAFAQRIGRSGRSITLPGVGRFAPGALRDEAEAMNVIQSSQLQQEIEQNVLGPLHQGTSVRQAVADAGEGETGARQLGSKVGAGLNMAQQKLTDNQVMSAAMSIGNAREQAFRLALYIDRRAAGWSPEAAALWTNKHLIDYGQMSTAEKQIGRRLFPFYSWTRHNVPLQLEYLFAKPGAFGGIQHVRETAAGGNPLGMAGVPMPSFLGEHVPIRTGTNDEGNPEFWRLEGTWPGADVGAVMSPDAAVDRVRSLVSPFLQEPAEQMTNMDAFASGSKGRLVPIEQTPGELGNLLGVAMPKRAIHALKNVRLVSELDRANPGNIFGTDTERAWGGAGPVRDYPQISGGQRLGNVFLGRGYAVDEGKNAAQWAQAWKVALSTLDRGIANAMARGQTEKAAQMQALRDRLQDHPEEIRPDQQR